MLRERVRTGLGVAAAILVMMLPGAHAEEGEVHRGTETRARQQPVAAGGVGGGSVATTGGPDNFGYSWIDSREIQGPAFDFLDISATGFEAELGDDDYASLIVMPFTFNYYGIDYNVMTIGSNGTVYFEDSYLGRENGCIPQNTGYSPQTFVALYWDDLDPGAAGQVYFAASGVEPQRTFIVQWEGVAHFGSSETLSAQVVFFEGTNNILMQFDDAGAVAGASATVGIQSEGIDGLTYSCDQPAVSAGLAVCFAPKESADQSCSSQVPVALQGFEID